MKNASKIVEIMDFTRKNAICWYMHFLSKLWWCKVRIPNTWKCVYFGWNITLRFGNVVSWWKIWHGRVHRNAAIAVVGTACTKKWPNQSSPLFPSHAYITNWQLRERVNHITSVFDTFIWKLIPIKVCATAAAVTFQVNIQPSERHWNHFTKQLHQLYTQLRKKYIFCESVWRKK